MEDGASSIRQALEYAGRPGRAATLRVRNSPEVVDPRLNRAPRGGVTRRGVALTDSVTS